ncbi:MULTISPECIES: hypothetical protein [Burkholderia]|uniref:hypothetical protein n=1 Tax=Burkholderia TaxID=32008 RepID=UPI000A5F8E8A|nr:MULTISPECIES: hypothetical protein [Burkholderia]
MKPAADSPCRNTVSRSRSREQHGEARRNRRDQDGGRLARRDAARVRAAGGAIARAGSRGEPRGRQITFDATGLAIMAILLDRGYRVIANTGIDATLILSGPIHAGLRKSIDVRRPEILVSIGLLIILMAGDQFN